MTVEELEIENASLRERLAVVHPVSSRDYIDCAISLAKRCRLVEPTREERLAIRWFLDGNESTAERGRLHEYLERLIGPDTSTLVDIFALTKEERDALGPEGMRRETEKLIALGRNR